MGVVALDFAVLLPGEQIGLGNGLSGGDLLVSELVEVVHHVVFHVMAGPDHGVGLLDGLDVTGGELLGVGVAAGLDEHLDLGVRGDVVDGVSEVSGGGNDVESLLAGIAGSRVGLLGGTATDAGGHGQCCDDGSRRSKDGGLHEPGS